MTPEMVADFFRNMGLPYPAREYKFHPERKWRFDFAWPEAKIALEVEGGVRSGGRHTSAAGYLRDIEKYNAAAVLGWRVLRCTPSSLIKLATVQMIKEAHCA